MDTLPHHLLCLKKKNRSKNRLPLSFSSFKKQKQINYLKQDLYDRSQDRFCPERLPESTKKESCL